VLWMAMESDFKTPVKNRCFFWGKTLNMIEASPFFRKTMPFLLERTRRRMARERRGAGSSLVSMETQF
jgi:hypothetical protein